MWFCQPMIMLAVLLSPTGANPSVFFIDSKLGSDTHDGRSAATAWRTLAPANNVTLGPGDIVQLSRGGVWRPGPSLVSPLLQIQGRGNMTHPVTYRAYGDGPKPLLLGSFH